MIHGVKGVAGALGVGGVLVLAVGTVNAELPSISILVSDGRMPGDAFDDSGGRLIYK